MGAYIYSEFSDAVRWLDSVNNRATSEGALGNRLVHSFNVQQLREYHQRLRNIYPRYKPVKEKDRRLKYWILTALSIVGIITGGSLLGSSSPADSKWGVGLGILTISSLTLTFSLFDCLSSRNLIDFQNRQIDSRIRGLANLIGFAEVQQKLAKETLSKSLNDWYSDFQIAQGVRSEVVAQASQAALFSEQNPSQAASTPLLISVRIVE